MRRRRIFLVAAAIVLFALSVVIVVRWRIQSVSEAKKSRIARILEIRERFAVLRRQNRKLMAETQLHEAHGEAVELSLELQKLIEEDRETNEPIVQKFLDIFRR
jgi:hypothetical protein